MTPGLITVPFLFWYSRISARQSKSEKISKKLKLTILLLIMGKLKEMFLLIRFQLSEATDYCSDFPYASWYDAFMPSNRCTDSNPGTFFSESIISFPDEVLQNAIASRIEAFHYCDANFLVKSKIHYLQIWKLLGNTNSKIFDIQFPCEFHFLNRQTPSFFVLFLPLLPSKYIRKPRSVLFCENLSYAPNIFLTFCGIVPVFVFFFIFNFTFFPDFVTSDENLFFKRLFLSSHGTKQNTFLWFELENTLGYIFAEKSSLKKKFAFIVFSAETTWKVRKFYH